MENNNQTQQQDAPAEQKPSRLEAFLSKLPHPDKVAIFMAFYFVGLHLILYTLQDDLAADTFFANWFWSPFSYIAGVLWFVMGTRIGRDYISRDTFTRSLADLARIFGEITAKTFNDGRDFGFQQGWNAALNRLEQNVADDQAEQVKQ